MKKFLYTTAIGVICCICLNAQTDFRLTALQITSTSTGRTTGTVANLTVFNPTTNPIEAQIGPCFIPSGGQYQPYIVPNIVRVNVPPGATVNVPLEAYCADIHLPPVPGNTPFRPVKEWIPAGPLQADWRPSVANGWKSTRQNSALVIPGTDIPLGHTIDINKHPSEAAPLLVETIRRIGVVFDSLKLAGAVSTPFSANPEKERESVIQQTFWIYTAQLTGAGYKVQDFAGRTVEQYEAATGTKFDKAPVDTQEQIQGGIVDFWNTFQAVGTEAKVLSTTAKEKALLCYDKKDCKPGSFLDSVTTEADCKAVGGKSVRDGLLGSCRNL